MAISKIDTAGLAADAVDNTILDLASNYSFSGTITGAGDPAKILQVVNATPINATTGSTSGTSSFATYLSKAITPSSASNKIYITARMNAYATSGTSYDGPGYKIRILRGSTAIFDNQAFYIRKNVNATGFNRGDLVIADIDSPNTTSEVTYNLQAHYFSPANSLAIYYSSLVLMEVAG